MFSDEARNTSANNARPTNAVNPIAAGPIRARANAKRSPPSLPERVGARREKGWFSSEAGALGAGFKGRSSKGADERTIRSPSGLRGQHRISLDDFEDPWLGAAVSICPTREKRRQSGTRAVDDAAATPAPRRESRPCLSAMRYGAARRLTNTPPSPARVPRARGHLLFFITPRAIPGARNRRRAPAPLRLAGTAPAMRRSESLKVFYVKVSGVDGARGAPPRVRAPRIPLSSSVTRFRP